ncbi:hypothetical protein M0802_000718 [Mischocyttarus mexicanus]|nr:hypothetical protein M0802_000718 [Mischocyttarus mexicanus]
MSEGVVMVTDASLQVCHLWALLKLGIVKSNGRTWSRPWGPSLQCNCREPLPSSLDKLVRFVGQHRFHCGLLDSSTEGPMRVESEKEKVKPLVVAVAVVAMPPNLEEGRETGYERKTFNFRREGALVVIFARNACVGCEQHQSNQLCGEYSRRKASRSKLHSANADVECDTSFSSMTSKKSKELDIVRRHVRRITGHWEQSAE